jgi:phage terminase Nu1 subunit (DNA packaging protein)
VLQAPAPAERYVTAGELADLMGVSVTTIRRLDKAGMPSESWGMKRTKRFLPSEAFAWAQSRTTPATIDPERDRADIASRQPQPKE